MPKNVVLCCDGTANEFARHKTNVVKLYSTLEHDPGRQVTFYHPGIGTMEPAGALTTFSRKLTKLLGMAVGYGLDRDIQNAYVFLMRNFRPGDQVFLFGFSRGAYTVRAVASLLYLYGLIPAGNEPLVPYMTRMMTGLQRGRRRTGERARRDVDDYFALAEEFKLTVGRTACKPHFVGVWDTVSSVGWIENPLKLPYVADNPDIAVGRQAIAIDERRAFFRNHLWRRSSTMQEHGPRDEAQVWFPGVHCDVGGGYAESESGLSQIALEWMLDEAEAHGLLIDDARRADVLGYAPDSRCTPPDATAGMHESLTRWWRFAEFVPKRHFDFATKREGRRMNLFRRRRIPAGAKVHEAAYQRGPAYEKLLPSDAVRVGKRAPSPRRAASAAAVVPPGAGPALAGGA